MMASLVPAINCKIDDQRHDANGRDADFIVLEPTMELAATYLDGVERYHDIKALRKFIRKFLLLVKSQK